MVSWHKCCSDFNCRHTFGDAEKRLPLAGSSAAPAANLSDRHTPYKIPSVLKNPPNRDVALESVHKFVDPSQLINPLDPPLKDPRDVFKKVKSSHSTHSSLCHIRTFQTVLFIHLYRHAPNISACNLEEIFFGPWSDGVQN
jgi:hypothetical protein